MKINEQINFDDITVGDGSQSVKPVTTTNPPKDTKLDMSVLKPFKPVKLSDNGQKVTANNNTYTFYPNGKVWDVKLKKHVTWSTKNGKVFVAGFELKSTTTVKTDKDKEIAKGKRLKYQESLIKNAIIFYEAVCRQMNATDWNEDYILKLIAKYVTPDQAPYIDALIRMTKGDQRDIRRKYLPQYNYWLSRGGKSGTTFQYLSKIPNKYMNGSLRDLFQGYAADYLDLDSNAPKIVKLKKQLRAIFPTIMKINTNVYNNMPFKGEKNYDQIHKMVMDIYNTKAFGSIKKL